MLTLTRTWNESIIIGENIEIQILEVRGGYVRVGINAPKSIAIHRGEVQERLQSKIRPTREKAGETP